jgi:protein-export membrane protein SecD/preprotein translocase SecF subunit
MKQMRFKIIFVALLTLAGLLAGIPSVVYFSLPKEVRSDPAAVKERLPSWLPSGHVNLGLDLQGGVQLVLGVGTEEAVDNKLARIGTEMSRWAEDKKIPFKTAYAVKGQQKLRVELGEGADLAAFKKLLTDQYPGLEQTGRDGAAVEFGYTTDRIAEIKRSAVEQAERVIRNRVDKWGVAEPLISRRANNTVLVQLPGFKDPEKAKEFLGRTAQLKFKIVDDDFKGFDNVTGLPETIKTERGAGVHTTLVSEDRAAIVEFAKNLIPADRELLFEAEPIAGGNKMRYRAMVVLASTELTGEDVLDAFVTQDMSAIDQTPVVSMRFTGPGGKRFETITGANVRKRMAIVLDDVVESAPVIQQKISGGQAQISLGSGRSWEEVTNEANELSLILKSGALPASINVQEERQVGASLGPELASQGIRSTILGIFFVFAFIIIYYRRPGLIASLSLLLNGVFLLALMALFNFSLTLPGIAGFILTLGMAVDANVLINERIRQELREGKTGRRALDSGFQRVFWTIVDSNATSIIAAMVLLSTNSSGPIRGFAITLLLGLLVSLFTSLYCSRLMFDIVISRCKSERDIRVWLGGTAEPKQYAQFNLNFLGMAPNAVIFTGVLVVAIIGTSLFRGINWAVDFAGGTEIEVGFSENVSASQLEESAKKAGIGDITIQALGGGQKQYVLRFDKDAHKKPDATEAAPTDAAVGSTSDAASATPGAPVMDVRTQNLQNFIKQDLASATPEILRVDFVGPQVGSELRTQGALSLLYALIGILLYIAMRFDMRFAPGSVIKMMSDIVIVMGFYVFFWRSFDLTSVAALLTVAGYTVNDTVVIYDRIRENLINHPGRPLRVNVNTAVNETLTRSLNTSISTLLSLIGIIVFASGSIWNFAVAMAVGVVAATFSSTFLATICVVWFEKWTSKAAAKQGQRLPSSGPQTV